MKYLLLGLLALLAGAGAARAQKITINQSGQTTTASSIYLASHLGFFKRQGLEVKFVVTGSGIKSIAPLVTGDTQFCACIVTHPMQANHSGAAETRLIAGITAGYPTKIVMRKQVADRLGLKPELPLADRVRMLKGLKIGISELGASTDQALRLAMVAYGLNPERDAIIIPLSTLQATMPALSNGQVDAASLSPPGPEQFVQEGIATLLFDPVGEHVAGLDVALFMGLTAEAGYLAKNRDVAVRVVRAIAEGQVYLQANREASAKLVKEKEFPNMPQEAFDIAFNGQFPTYQKTPDISRESIAAAIKAADLLIPNFKGTYETLVDPTIARDAMR